ncbi:MAG: DNA internalization-related competence protein ComEC/Rec2 [Anaerolineae bacterium]|nr:DNA internalization-related competence protein ComEC/Rec2 [Anaerolineae bacterium]
MTLIYLGCAWLTGIFLGSLLHLPSGFVGLLTLLPLAGLLLWRKDQRVRLISVCFLSLLLGILRFNASAAPQDFDEGHLTHYNDQGWVKIAGIVSGEPDVRDTYTNLRVAVSEIEVDGQEHEVRGTVLVRAPRYPEYDYGDELEIEGLLETPPELEDFSYQEYLARQGIYSVLWRPQITLKNHDQGSVPRRALLAFKRRAQRVIALILHDPQAALLTGILLGVETGIPADLMRAFSATGTTHIIAISGFNISIIAGLFSGLSTRLFGKRRAMPVALAGIIIYTILVGASAAVVRAAIMGCLYVIATHYGRQTHALTLLMAAAILMTLLNPQTLRDLGFQLSFAATLGLIIYTPGLQGWFEKLLSKVLSPGTAKRVVGMLNEALIVTLAAQITTMPIIVYHFRQLSLVTLLSNFLILPAQPGVMLWGGLATIAGLIWLPLGQVLGWIAWLFLTYTIRAVEITASVPYASFNLGNVSPGLVGLYYGLLAGAALVSRQEPSRLKSLWRRLTDRLSTKVLIAGLAVAAILIWVAVASLPDGKLHVVFFDVGEGDAIFIETPRGQQILVDGGPSPTTLISALGRRMPFWDRSVDLIILTHADEDHLAGLIPVLERYRVGQVLDSGYEHDNPMYERWLELINEKEIPAHLARAGMRIGTGDGVELAVLHPGPELMKYTDADANNNSVVVRLVMGQVSFLLTGDIEEAAEGMLVASGQELTSTVLKAPHHGSNTSSSAAFLNAASPELVVISVGADNRFGHPAPQVLERLEDLVGEERILRTDENGAIEVVTDGERIWIKTRW